MYPASNLGESTILGAPRPGGIEVEMKKLSTYVLASDPKNLSVMKIDIEGAEPIALSGFFEEVSPDYYPDYILYEHAHTDKWRKAVSDVFPQEIYKVETVFQHNTLLRRKSVAGTDPVSGHT